MKQKIDGRNLRRTGRTAQLATKVRPEIKDMIYELAESCDMAINEIIEASVEAIYREKMSGQNTSVDKLSTAAE